MKLAYQAYNQSGQLVSDFIEATGIVEATDDLRRRGLLVADIKPASRERTSSTSAPTGRRFRLGYLKELMTFVRHLDVLLKAGTPLVSALGALERQTADANWRQVIAGVRAKVQEGSSLTEALRARPDVFDSVTCSLIAAGERSGKLEDMLHRLADVFQKRLHVQRQVLGALTYPVLLVVVSTSVMGLLIGFVLPRFASLFTTLKVPLPPTTQLLMGASTILRGYWWALLIAAVVITVAAWRFACSARGRYLLATAAIRAPLLGTLVRSMLTARMIRVLGTLLGSHVSLLETLELTRDASGNPHYEALMNRATDLATKGESLSAAFAGSNLISASVYEAIRNGEQTGAIDELLLSLADFLDEENEVILRSVTALIGPVILMLLGLMVGFVAISLFLPLFDLTSAIPNGGPS